MSSLRKVSRFNKARLPVILLLFAAAFVAQVSASEPSPAWSWLAPQPQGNEIMASAYDPQRDLTVAVGKFGTVMVRTSRGPWEVRQIRSGGRFSCITWTGKVFVVGSESGGLFRSLDGLTWSRINLGQFNSGPNSPPSSSGNSYWLLNGDQFIVAIATGDNGVTVALAGDSSSVWVSSDQERRTWTKYALPTSPKPANSWPSYLGMSYGKGLFVAVGSYGFVATSSNGTSWTKRTSGTRRDLDFMASNGTYFVAMDSDSWSRGNHAYDNTDARVVRSADGVTWASISPDWPRGNGGDQDPDVPNWPLSAGTRFLIEAQGAAYVSEDFISWDKLGQPADVSYLYALQGTGPTTGNRTLVFRSGGAMLSLGNSAAELEEEIEDSQLSGTTVAGLDNLLVGGNNWWSALDGVVGDFLESDNFWTDSVFQQKGFLVGSRGDYADTKSFVLLQRNADGSGKWVSLGSTEAPLPGTVAALAAATATGPVVCFLRSKDGTAPHRLYYSADWINWELRASYAADDNYYTDIMQLEHDGQRFVMLTPERKIAISANGREWSELNPLPSDSSSFRQRFHPNDSSLPTANFPDAIASNGRSLLASTLKTKTSSDGYSYSVASVDGRFFVWDLLSSSPSWKEVVTPWASVPEGRWSTSNNGPALAGARTLIWNGSLFMKLPQDFSPEREPQAGRCFTSPDGERWTQREMPTQASHVAWTGSQFLASSEWGRAILVHPNGLSPEIVSSLRIAKQPDSVAAYNGETVSFEIIAETDLPGLSYQWFKDGKSVKNATKSFLTVKASTAATGRYHVVLRTTNGTTTVSADAFLSLRPAAIWTWKDGLAGDRVIKLVGGQSIELGLINVEGPGQIRYQWYKDGGAIKGATGASLTLSGVTPSAAGIYTVVITTSVGAVTTESRRVAVDDNTQLVYSVKGTSQVSKSIGAAAAAEALTGFMVVDRSESNPRAAFLWVGKSGYDSHYVTEQIPDADMRSTGPWTKTMSVVSLAHTAGESSSQTRELIWISGADSLVKLDNAASILAPGTLSGWKNSIRPAGEELEIRSSALSLVLDKSLTLGNRGKNFDNTLESLKTSLQSKGIFPKPE